MVFEKFFGKKIETPETVTQEQTSNEQEDKKPIKIEGVTQEEVEKVKNAYEKHQDIYQKAILEFREGLESLGLGTLMGAGVIQFMKYMVPEASPILDTPAAYATAIGAWSVVAYGLKKLFNDTLSDNKFKSLMLDFKHKEDKNGTA